MNDLLTRAAMSQNSEAIHVQTDQEQMSTTGDIRFFSKDEGRRQAVDRCTFETQHHVAINMPSPTMSITDGLEFQTQRVNVFRHAEFHESSV